MYYHKIVNIYIQSEYRIIQTGKNSVFRHSILCISGSENLRKQKTEDILKLNTISKKNVKIKTYGNNNGYSKELGEFQVVLFAW